MSSDKKIIFAHSPDSDDAFMYYGIAKGKFSIPGYSIDHYMADIEKLNSISEKNIYQVSAISASKYPSISDKYRIMSCGSSMGRNYGPVVVTTKNNSKISDFEGSKIAVPGKNTTSWALFRIFSNINCVPLFVNFDEVEQTIKSGEADLGILLHEGQILYEKRGFNLLLNLGESWYKETALPLPLGLDVVCRQLDEKLCKEIANISLASIKYALSNMDKAIEYSKEISSLDESNEDIKKFINMYVNDDTIDMGEQGIEALAKLYQLSLENKIIEKIPELDIIQAEDA
ncbi:MAG: menaquinone biosynthesis family protein [Dehalococcoidia bacterium]